MNLSLIPGSGPGMFKDEQRARALNQCFQGLAAGIPGDRNCRRVRPTANTPPPSSLPIASRAAGRTPSGAARDGRRRPGHRPGPSVGAPSDARHLDFLRPTRACIGAPQIPGFCPVGIVWNSLDSLVRNEPFQWVTRDPGPILFFGGPFPPEGVAKAGRHRPKLDHAEAPRPGGRGSASRGSWRSTSQGSDRALRSN